MRMILSVLLGCLLCGVAFADAPIPVSGADASFPGAFRIGLKPGQFQLQDVFTILHGTQPIGEAILVTMTDTRGVLVPSLHVTERVYPGGFSVVFLRHHSDVSTKQLSPIQKHLLEHPAPKAPGLVAPGEKGAGTDPVEIISFDAVDRDVATGGSASYINGVQWSGACIIKNNTKRPLAGVAITVRFLDGYGQELHQEEKQVGTLPAGDKYGMDFTWLQPVKGLTKVVAEARYLPSLTKADILALKRAGEPVPPANVALVVKQERASSAGGPPRSAGTEAPGTQVDRSFTPDPRPVGY